MTIPNIKNRKLYISMEKLKKQYSKNKNTYVQLEEGENHYLYGVWNLKDSPEDEPSYYEVFRKKVRKAETIKGQPYPEREAYPGDNISVRQPGAATPWKGSSSSEMKSAFSRVPLLRISGDLTFGGISIPLRP